MFHEKFRYIFCYRTSNYYPNVMHHIHPIEIGLVILLCKLYTNLLCPWYNILIINVLLFGSIQHFFISSNQTLNIKINIFSSALRLTTPIILTTVITIIKTLNIIFIIIMNKKFKNRQ